VGEQQVESRTDPRELRELTLALLDDLDALEQLIRQGAIESGVRRIGAEQELFLVDSAWRPAPLAMEVLERLEGEQFVTELGRYNLEINLPPLSYGGNCLSEMLRLIEDNIAEVRSAAAPLGAQPMLVGILPTLRKSDLTIDNMTPRPRYYALNEAMNALRGGPWLLHVKGLEELASRHDNVMLESCCTSFQIHLQVSPEEFAQRYNLAQAVTPVVLAAAVNSPILFGRRLWQETRIPLFQQSIDERRTGHHLREASPRVRFGERWVDDSILDILREDVVRFRILLSGDRSEAPHEVLARGEYPDLSALRLHNGTVYRWNRGCYGVGNGKPHLRIEMRALPSGPTPVDEMANAAFFFGLVLGLSDTVPDVRPVMPFDNARANFSAAAKRGLDAQLIWFGGERIPARELILEVLLPIAHQGLTDTGIDPGEATRFLDIIEDRVAGGHTGARWQLGSFARLTGRGATRNQVTTAVTAAMAENQASGEPVHTWPWARLEGARTMDPAKLRVEDIMTSDLYTIGPEEPVDLVGKIMEWKSIRHIPVEDRDHRVVGMLSCFHVLRYLGERGPSRTAPPASELMGAAPPSIGPEAPIAMALAMMREQSCDCLPVVHNSRLVGIITERDLVRALWHALGGGETAT
jgi:CBS domain-containing protein